MSLWSVFCVHSNPSQSARWQHLSFVRVYVRKFCIFAGWAAARHEMREMWSVFVWLGTQQWLPCLFQGHCSLVGSSDFPVSWPGTILLWLKDEFFENINFVTCMNASFPVQGLGEWWRQPAEQRWRCENRVRFGLQMHKRELNVVAKRTDSWLVLGWLGKVARQLKTIEDVDNKKPMPYLKQSLKK